MVKTNVVELSVVRGVLSITCKATDDRVSTKCRRVPSFRRFSRLFDDTSGRGETVRGERCVRVAVCTSAYEIAA